MIKHAGQAGEGFGVDCSGQATSDRTGLADPS